MKKNKFACHKQYLLSRFTSNNAKKIPTDQIYDTTFCLKKTTHKPLKVAAAKNLFSSGYVIGNPCFDERFSLRVVTQRFF